MDWNQIENNWVAMTLRVRGNCNPDIAMLTKAKVRRGARVDLSLAKLSDLPSEIAAAESRKLSAE